MPTVTAVVKKELLALKKEDLTISFILSKVAKSTIGTKDADGNRTFKVIPPVWDMQAKLHLDAGEYTNKEAVDTTLGRFLSNKMLFEGTIDSILPNGYYNETITKKSMGKIMDRVATALMEKKVDLNPNVVQCIQAFEVYGLMLCSAVSPSMTPGLLSVDDEVRAERDKLFAKFDDHPDVLEASKIEDHLTAMAAKKLKGDPGMTLFDSGSRGSFADNYKNMSLMLGPVKDPATGHYDVVKSNFIDGLQKQDLPALGNSVVNAAYPKAISTAEGGYLTKQFYAVYQSIQLDESGSDCGSHGYLEIFLTDSNYNDYMYQYAVGPGGKLTILTADNKSQFVNRRVKLRSPIGCLSPKICNVCMGERFYILGIRNAGLTAGRVPNSIMNANMKAFHITKVQINEVDPDKLLLD